MTFVDPTTIHNPATSTIAPASWGDTVNDDLNFLGRDKPYAKIYHNIDQVPVNVTNAWSPLAMNSEAYDNQGMHSNVTNNSRLTCPIGGIYMFGWAIEYLTFNEGNINRNIGAVFINGGATEFAVQQHMLPISAGSNRMRLSGSTFHRFSATHYMELNFYTTQTSLGFGSSVLYADKCTLWAMWVAV